VGRRTVGGVKVGKRAEGQAETEKGEDVKAGKRTERKRR
jgi:hypothetical protein